MESIKLYKAFELLRQVLEIAPNYQEAKSAINFVCKKILESNQKWVEIAKKIKNASNSKDLTGRSV